MQWRVEGAAEALHSPIPWVAFSAAVALAFTGWIGLERNRVDEARAQFERRTETAEGAVRTRLAAYEQVLRSTAARIASEPAITSGEWHAFIEHLQIEERFPGIQSVAYARRLKGDGFPTVFAEPATTRNANLIGYDPFRDPVRRAAMERARDTGEASISGKVTFSGNARAGIVENVPGFVMAVPVFRQDVRRIPYPERDAQLSGYVLGTYRMLDLMRGILDEGVLQGVDMKVYDEPNATEGNLLIDTRTAWRANPSSEPPVFSRRARFPVQGRTWTVEFLSRPDVDAAIAASRPWAVLAAGLVASILIFALTLALVASWNRAHHLSMRDPLTGLYNRRYLEETMTREMPRARRLGESVGVLVVDIDHFKRLNDTFGHDAGDFVLERTGEMLRAATRNSDIACRFGGEEFAVILPGAPLLAARNRAEGIRAAIESMQLDFGGRNLGSLTVSVGVAAMSPHAQDWSFTLQQADRALYAAKQAGRNKVMTAVND